MVLACLTQVALATAAAAPIDEKRAEAERIQRQIEEQGERLSILDEQANRARVDAARLASETAEAEAALAAARTGLTEARQRLRDVAVDAYVRGGRSPGAQSLLYDDGSSLAIRQGYLAHTAARQSQAIDGLRAAEADLAERRVALRQTKEAADAAAAQAVAARTEAERVLVSYRATLDQVKGDLAVLVAEEERRRAEEEARRVRARLEAERRAREEAARRAAAEAARRRTPVVAAPRPPADEGLAGDPDAPAPAPNANAAAAVEEARRQLGKPYEWGGAGPDSFDCSGLTAWAWRAGGVRLSHSSQVQYRETARVSLAHIQPGDLVFYGSPIHHVGIYVGGGRMVNAPRTGYDVRYDNIYRDDLVGVGRPR